MVDGSQISPEAQKAAHKEAAMRMFNTSFDCFDSLVTKLHETAGRTRDETLMAALPDLQYIEGALATVFTQKIRLSHSDPEQRDRTTK